MTVSCLGLGEGQSQTNDPLESIRNNAFAKIAEYETPSNPAITNALERLGFRPGASKEIWNSFPAIRKLESAYGAAQAGEAGGGNRLLAQLVKQLGDEYPPIRTDRTLQAFSEKFVGAGDIKFATPDPNFRIFVESEEARIIQIISDYVDRGALGGVRSILIREFGIPEAAAYNIMAKSRSNAAALRQAYREIPAANRRDRMLALLREIEKVSPALSKESAIIAFKDALREQGVRVPVPPVVIDQSKTPDVKNDDPIGECYCGKVLLGIMRRSQCPEHTRC